jgi:hypothetical protein
LLYHITIIIVFWEAKLVSEQGKIGA